MIETIKFMAKSCNKSSWPYTNIYDFVHKNGRIYTYHSLPKGIRKGQMGKCFMNAYHLAESDNRFTYVEGFALIPNVGVPILHAWCVDADDNAFDVTWKDGSTEYFGVPFDLSYVRKIIFSKETYGVIDNWKQRFPLLSGEHIDFRPKRS